MKTYNYSVSFVANFDNQTDLVRESNALQIVGPADIDVIRAAATDWIYRWAATRYINVTGICFTEFRQGMPVDHVVAGVAA